MFDFIKIREKSAVGVRQTKKEIVAAIIGVVIILFVVNFLGSRHFFRVDLTEGGQYTLSKSTKDILKNLEDVVNVRVYFSKNLPPQLVMMKNEVDDILSEYRTYAGQKLKVQYVDPQESQQTKYQVMMMGIPPVQINVIEKDKAEVAEVFLGMAVVHEDRTELIPVVQGVGTLEYELTSAIIKVSTSETKSIAWLGNGDQGTFGKIKELLRNRYEVRDIDVADFSLDPAKDSLLVLALEKDLTDSELFEIDQYMMKGGKVLLHVDRINVGNNLKVSALDVSNVLSWLKNFNISIENELVRDRSNAHAAFAGDYVTYHVPYPFFVKVGRSGFDQDNPIVAELDTLVLPWTSPLKIESDRPEGVQYTVLVRSSQYSSVVETDASLMPDDAHGTNIPEGKPKPLAILAEGNLPSFFAEGRNAPPIKNAKVIASAEGSQIIVIGNTRFVQNSFLQQFTPNTLFFENAVDYLAMGNQLIGIRSKGVTERPIGEISGAGISFVKYLNILSGPIFLVGCGLIVMFLRKRKRATAFSLFVRKDPRL